MEKDVEFSRTWFDAAVIEKAAARFREQEENDELNSTRRSIQRGSVRWTLDTDEEFFAEYRRERDGHGTFSIQHSTSRHIFVRFSPSSTSVSVAGVTRTEIEGVMALFERAAPESALPAPPKKPIPPPTVFIGHGRSKDWRDLKDHLGDYHGHEVVAYETGARAGHTIRDVLDDMLKESTFALLVMTPEDETADGETRARQNVIHEVGLFQGRLGFARAIVVLKEGTEEFSNIAGIQQIRYSTNIRETFGDVLATLRREFPR